ncbi:hypothetical protein P152DRAFT_458450 [Eremomyces bilateralis CBS 781.70]|uniref:HTH TFE/IIEalpha-type domain-containing protein n=1 Tax=Eremomyces bilateralis CBS 781.70 TaxID=1392243 RepID=A0A6G1G3K5_9PEZI|nr:uncharacterized protein P152DRAFT_458450 [Eremomyces bilateralis CBS 781.70]KAF1812633.1 hypothetical protein P152DRAFT_458450 [Eremomyces bilateralis CBS 781.70]
MSKLTRCSLSLSDLAVVMDSGKQVKNVQKLCAKLREAGLVSVHARQETREGAQKPITREYFYIDYRRAIDSTKYRIHMLDEEIKREARPTTERKEYICKRCESQWTLMEVLDNPDPSGSGSGFLCKKCGFGLELKHDEDAAGEADDRPAMFNKQFGHLLTLLQRIDDSVVPEVTGEDALAEAVPVPRDEMVNPAMRTTTNELFAKPAAVRGIATGPENIEIAITTHSETTAAEQAAAAAHKERIAKQNQLPVWHTQSTVTGPPTIAGQADGGSRDDQAADGAAQSFGDEAGEDIKDPSLDAYFEQLKAEQERQALKEAEEEEEEEEDDEDEDEDEDFEDVVAPAVNGTSTGPELDDQEREAKRVKIESPPAKVEDKAGDDEESDADDFEDAL